MGLAEILMGMENASCLIYKYILSMRRYCMRVSKGHRSFLSPTSRHMDINARGPVIYIYAIYMHTAVKSPSGACQKLTQVTLTIQMLLSHS